MPVAYTNFLSIASCRIVNIQYRNDLLITEKHVVNSCLVLVDTAQHPSVLVEINGAGFGVRMYAQGGQ